MTLFVMAVLTTTSGSQQMTHRKWRQFLPGMRTAVSATITEQATKTVRIPSKLTC